jgi:hypothetical protein
MMGDMMGGPRSTQVEALQQQSVIWLSSVRPDGLPHIVPMWFMWDGVSILAFSKPQAQRHGISGRGRGSWWRSAIPGTTSDVEPIEGIAELVADRSRELPEPFARKYGGLIDRAGITLGRYAEVYSQPIRIGRSAGSIGAVPAGSDARRQPNACPSGETSSAALRAVPSV